MVNTSMLISQFAREAGLPVETVRFYVRKGLLRPELGRKGGSNPYQIFNQEHLQSARLIKLAQSLGFTLREIAAVVEEAQTAELSTERKIEILQSHIAKLDAKVAKLDAVRNYFLAKLIWMEAGEIGPAPEFVGLDCA